MPDTALPADHNSSDHAYRSVDQMVPVQVWWMIGEGQMVPAPESLHSRQNRPGALLRSLHRPHALAQVVWLSGSLLVYVTSVSCLFLSSHVHLLPRLPRFRDRPPRSAFLFHFHPFCCRNLSIRQPGMNSVSSVLGRKKKESTHTHRTRRKQPWYRDTPTWTTSNSADPTGPKARFRSTPRFRRWMWECRSLRRRLRKSCCLFWKPVRIVSFRGLTMAEPCIGTNVVRE